jgi:hypothetical protein
MTANRMRLRAERGEVQIGTAGGYASDAAVLQSGYASVVAAIRRGH